MNDELTNFVIKELGKHHNRNEIIRAVCERGGLNWSEAERFIKDVEGQHGRTITARQSPFLVFLSLGIAIMGIVLFVNNGMFFVSFFQADTLEKALELQSAYYRAAGLLTGIGMLIGGIIGIWQTAVSFLKE